MPRPSVPALALSLGLILAVPATAQVMPDPSAEDVAKTPLRDLNIDKKDVPPALQKAATDPYGTAGLGTCSSLVREIAALDAVLGADYDIAVTEEENGKLKVNEGRLGQSIVGSIIPFRGVLREVTGAASSQRALEAAYTAGMARRSYLKGWGQGRGCAYPARPKVAATSAKKATGRKK
ncbi:MAG: hypothetical protein ACKO01_04630 [Erythrobacter sp.]